MQGNKLVPAVERNVLRAAPACAPNTAEVVIAPLKPLKRLRPIQRAGRFAFSRWPQGIRAWCDARRQKAAMIPARNWLALGMGQFQSRHFLHWWCSSQGD